MEKECLAGVETLVQSPTCRMDTRETPAAKATDATALQTEPRDECIFAIQKTFLSKEEVVEHRQAWLPIGTQK